MLISTEFECGNGKNIRKTGDSQFALETDGEGAPGYNYYFYLRLIGESKKENVRLDVYADQSLGGKKYRNFCEDQAAVLWIKRDKGPWMRFLDFSVDNNECYRISLSVRYNETIYLSNMLPLPYSELSSWIKAFARKHGSCVQLHILGRSSQGRDIYHLRITNPRVSEKQKKKILVVAGEHGIETPGLWAVRGIVECLVTSISYAKRLREKYLIDIFPQINPDGNATGRPQKNATNVDIFRDFTDASLDKLPMSQEGKILWTWGEKNQPDICLNFHGWVCGPTCFRGSPPYEGAFVVPLRVYKSEKAKGKQAVVNDYLSWETEALTYRGSFLTLEKDKFLHQLALKYGTAGCLYEPNMYRGMIDCKRIGVHVLNTVVEAVESLS